MRGGVVALPPHQPCGNAGCGAPNGEGMTLVCVATRAFVKIGLAPGGGFVWGAEDGPGCAKAFPLCPSCGTRSCPCAVTRARVTGSDVQVNESPRLLVRSVVAMETDGPRSAINADGGQPAWESRRHEHA